MFRHQICVIVRAARFVSLGNVGIVLSFVIIGRPYYHRQYKYKLLIGCNVDKLKESQGITTFAVSHEVDLFAHFNNIEFFHEAKIILLAIPTTNLYIAGVSDFTRIFARASPLFETLTKTIGCRKDMIP